MEKKKKFFKKDQMELILRDNQGKKIFQDKGEPRKVLAGYVGKFEGFSKKIESFGVRIDRRRKDVKKLMGR